MTPLELKRIKCLGEKDTELQKRQYSELSSLALLKGAL